MVAASQTHHEVIFISPPNNVRLIFQWKKWGSQNFLRHYQRKTFDPKDTVVKYLPATNQLEVQHG